jgi:hypothetical protein
MELMRRHQVEMERKERELIHHERERDRDRERERDERDAQRELAVRNFERDRDRMEQLRIAGYQRHPYTGRMPETDAQMISAQCLINAIITENIRPSDSRERGYVSRNLSLMFIF